MGKDIKGSVKSEVKREEEIKGVKKVVQIKTLTEETGMQQIPTCRSQNLWSFCRQYYTLVRVYILHDLYFDYFNIISPDLFAEPLYELRTSSFSLIHPEVLESNPSIAARSAEHPMDPRSSPFIESTNRRRRSTRVSNSFRRWKSAWSFANLASALSSPPK